MKTTIKGTATSKRVSNVPGHEDAVAVGGYAPAGYDNTIRRTIKDRAAMGCIQVLVTESQSGLVWIATEQISGRTLGGTKEVWHNPEDFASYAAAIMGGEYQD